MEASAGFLDTARTRPDAQVRWHAGINLDMPQLAGWARAVLAGMAEQREIDNHRGATTPRLEAQAAVA